MENKESSIGTTISIIIIILIIIIGGLYFWGKTLSQKNQASQNPPAINVQNSTDTVSNIKNDLNSIDTKNLDNGFTDVQKELK